MKTLATLTLLLAAAAARSQTPAFHNILDYGAVADGKTKITDAIAKAISAASDKGGGTIFFPAGTYLTGPILLKSNITLNLDAGCTLKFSDDFADYLPMVTSRYEGTMVKSFSPLISAYKADNIAITGRGVIDGQGQKWWAATRGNSREGAGRASPPEGPWIEAFARANEGNPAPILKRGFLRPPFFQPQECTRVLVEGIKVINSPFWTLTPLFCDNVTVRAVTIANPTSPNTDGINPDSCTNVHISDCHISVGDDCVTIKSGRDEEGRRIARPCENITIDNCTMLAGHGGVTIGSEQSAGVRNVTISNCVFDGTDRGIRIKASRGRGGTVEDIRVSNIVMRNIKNEAIHITSMYDRSQPEPVSDRTPIFRDIHISGVTGSAKSACEILGLAEMPISGITLTDIQLQTKGGLSIRYASDIELRDIRVTPDNGAALIANDVDALRITNLNTLGLKHDAPLLDLGNVKAVYITACAPPPGTKALVTVPEPSAPEVTLEANRLPPGCEGIIKAPSPPR